MLIEVKENIQDLVKKLHYKLVKVCQQKANRDINKHDDECVKHRRMHLLPLATFILFHDFQV